MKINDSSGAGVSGLDRAAELNASTTASTSRNGGSNRNDQVSLSSLSSALRAQHSESPGHAARLAQLSAAVATGTYQVDSQALSTTIISGSMRS